MASIKERRQHARFVVQWPLFYANDELIGQGALLNLSQVGCQIAGTMPVHQGMILRMWVSPAHKEECLCVEEARVLWVKEHEFGLELGRLHSADHRWLKAFLETAERRDSFRRISGGIDFAAMPLALPVKD